MVNTLIFRDFQNTLQALRGVETRFAQPRTTGRKASLRHSYKKSPGGAFVLGLG
jgi:hypothetical protein